MAKKIIVYRFYEGEKCVMLLEYPVPLSKEELKERAKQAVEWGYGTPDQVVDSNGRLVKLD